MEEYDYYPQKPELVEKKVNNGAGKAIFSLLLFVMASCSLTQRSTAARSCRAVLLLHSLAVCAARSVCSCLCATQRRARPAPRAARPPPLLTALGYP